MPFKSSPDGKTISNTTSSNREEFEFLYEELYNRYDEMEKKHEALQLDHNRALAKIEEQKKKLFILEELPDKVSYLESNVEELQKKNDIYKKERDDANNDCKIIIKENENMKKEFTDRQINFESIIEELKLKNKDFVIKLNEAYSKIKKWDKIIANLKISNDNNTKLAASKSIIIKNLKEELRMMQNMSVRSNNSQTMNLETEMVLTEKEKEYEKKYKEMCNVSSVCVKAIQSYASSFVASSQELMNRTFERNLDCLDDSIDVFNQIVKMHKKVVIQNKHLKQEINALKEQLEIKEDEIYRLMHSSELRHGFKKQHIPMNNKASRCDLLIKKEINDSERGVESKRMLSTRMLNRSNSVNRYSSRIETNGQRQLRNTRTPSISRSDSITKLNDGVTFESRYSNNSLKTRQSRTPSVIRSDNMTPICSKFNRSTIKDIKKTPSTPISDNLNETCKTGRLPAFSTNASNQKRYVSLFHGSLKCDSGHERNEEIENRNMKVRPHLRSCYNPSHGTYDEGLNHVDKNVERKPITPKKLN